MRILVALALLAAALPAPARASICQAFVEELRRDLPGLRYAQLGDAGVAPGAVRITYVAHSTYRIETADGIVIATDYFGEDGPGRVPDAVTMNHAHSTHYTDARTRRSPMCCAAGTRMATVPPGTT